MYNFRVLDQVREGELTGIFRAEDDHLLIGKVDSNGRRRSHTASVPIGGESASIVNDVVRVEVLQVLSRRADQHITHEEGMVGASTHDTDAYPVTLVPAGKSIDDIDAVPGVEVVNGALAVDAPDLESQSVNRA
jgi:hypothetical protein